ncbi:MAG: type II CAAX endopeptidase family protein [Planctomycetota bacterium]|nr:type II CAAX endopeptidase family protein [Planctomycetota bacterium]
MEQQQPTLDNTPRSRRPAWQLWTLITTALILPMFVAPVLAPTLGLRLDSVITRLIMILGVSALLWYFGFPTRAWCREVAGAHPWRGLLGSLLVTVIFCSLYSLTLIYMGAERMRPEIFRPDRLATAVFTGLLVSVVEEPVFRHTMLRGLSLRGRFWVGAVLSSGVYALAHYARPDKVPTQASFDLNDSLAVYSEMLGNLLGPFHDPVPFVGLFLLGLLLCTVVRRAGLAWTIGIHAGLVYYVKADACLLYWNFAERDWLFGSGPIKYDGALFWLTCGLFLLGLGLRPGRQTPFVPPSSRVHSKS